MVLIVHYLILKIQKKINDQIEFHLSACNIYVIYRISVVGILFHPSLGPAVARTPPRRNSLPSNGKSSRLPLLLRRSLPKILRSPPKLLLLLLIDGDGDD